MTPYYEHAGITIYHGDCRDVLPRLPMVDLLLSDPPYGVAYQTKWRSRESPLRCAIANDGDMSICRDAWPRMTDRLADDRHWYVFTSPRRIAQAAAIFVGARHIIAWDKGDMGTAGDLESGFGEAWEAIFYGMKGRRPLRGRRPRTVLRFDWSSTMDPVHPTVKPVPLLGRMIEWSTEPGEIVLDAFAGSGTTLRAAKDLGRRAIGIEIEERYCEIAARRLSQGALALDGVRP